MTPDPSSILSRLFQDLKERFLKIGTLRGMYLIPLGAIGLWIILTSFQYILHALAALVFAAAIVEGLYQLLHNPIKKEAVKQDLVSFRKEFNAEIDELQDGARSFLSRFGHWLVAKTSPAVEELKTETSKPTSETLPTDNAPSANS